MLHGTFREQFIFKSSILKHLRSYTEKIQGTFPVNYISKDRAACGQYFLLYIQLLIGVINAC